MNNYYYKFYKDSKKNTEDNANVADSSPITPIPFSYVGLAAILSLILFSPVYAILNSPSSISHS